MHATLHSQEASPTFRAAWLTAVISVIRAKLVERNFVAESCSSRDIDLAANVGKLYSITGREDRWADVTHAR
jgi:hypothetical protein